MPNKVCSVDGCGRTTVARGLCNRHYLQARAHRTPLPDVIAPGPDYLLDPLTGCWIWQKVLNNVGYGQKRVNGRTRLAHRWVFEAHRGPIPEGLTLDHLCRAPSCVNPDHLEPVTHKVNILRGTGMSARHAVQTHCVNGHELSPENTYVRKNGGRMCKACSNERRRRKNSEYRALNPLPPKTGMTHGKVSTYTRGCRCGECVEVGRAYHRERWHRLRGGNSVSAGR